MADPPFRLCSFANLSSSSGGKSKLAVDPSAAIQKSPFVVIAFQLPSKGQGKVEQFS